MFAINRAITPDIHRPKPASIFQGLDKKYANEKKTRSEIAPPAETTKPNHPSP
jgi:hypothetical protein